MDSFLSARGLTLEENLGPPSLETRHLGGTTDPTYRVGAFYGLALARATTAF